MNYPVTEPLLWGDLSKDSRELLTGKLAGLWGAATDQEAFEALAIDKQQALILLLVRIHDKALWHLIRKITNVYGEGGVGLQFLAWPIIESTLDRRKDFTRRFATHKDTSGGFYEKDRPLAVLHFLFQEGDPRTWYVHFDLHSPVHSLGSAYKHLRHEFLGKVTPDWRMISRCLDSQLRQGKV